jgi:hypothetical protein
LPAGDRRAEHRQSPPALGRRSQGDHQGCAGGRERDITNGLQHAQPEQQHDIRGEDEGARTNDQRRRANQQHNPHAIAIDRRTRNRPPNERGDTKGAQDQADLPIRQSRSRQIARQRHQQRIEPREEQQRRGP